MNCHCGEPSPCRWHETTDEMRQAHALLRAMLPEQRGRILCWFCPACCAELPPGVAHDCPAKEATMKKPRQKTKSTSSERIRIAYPDWLAEGRRRFGDNTDAWKFVCPCCGHVASVADWRAVGAPEGAVAFSCIGRWMPNPRGAFAKGSGPCNYAGGGLFQLNPVTITDAPANLLDAGGGRLPHPLFRFAFAEAS